MRVTLNVADQPGMRGPKRYAQELARVLPGLGVQVRVRRSRPVRVGPLTLAPHSMGDHMPVFGAGDVLHAVEHRSNPRRRPAQVVTIHDFIAYEYPGLVDDPELSGADGRAVERAVQTARRILVPTEHVRNLLIHRFRAGREQVKVVPMGVRAEHFRPDLRPWPTSPFRPGRLNVLVTMGLDRRKRVDLVARAALQVPDVHLVQVGPMQRPDGDPVLAASLAKAAGELAAQGRFVQRDTVDDNTLRGLYSQCDVFVHPSAAEGFGLPPLEALACGARVIASDVPAHREVLGEQARYVDLAVDAIARELEACWDGQGVRDGRFAPREARIAHARRYPWERTARETALAYREAMGMRRR